MNLNCELREMRIGPTRHYSLRSFQLVTETEGRRHGSNRIAIFTAVVAFGWTFDVGFHIDIRFRLSNLLQT